MPKRKKSGANYTSKGEEKLTERSSSRQSLIISSLQSLCSSPDKYTFNI